MVAARMAKSAMVLQNFQHYESATSRLRVRVAYSKPDKYAKVHGRLLEKAGHVGEEKEYTEARDDDKKYPVEDLELKHLAI